jgi:hypothetical protein
MAASAFGTDHRDCAGDDADEAGPYVSGRDGQEDLGRRWNYDPEDDDPLVTHGMDLWRPVPIGVMR